LPVAQPAPYAPTLLLEDIIKFNRQFTNFRIYFRNNKGLRTVRPQTHSAAGRFGRQSIRPQVDSAAERAHGDNAYLLLQKVLAMLICLIINT